MKELLIFLAGLGIGSGVTYVALKGQYDEQLEEEVAELMNFKRDTKKRRKKASKRVTEASDEPVEAEKEEEEEIDDEDRETYAKIVKGNYSKSSPQAIVKNRHKPDPKIFLLSPKAAASSEKEQKTVFLYGDGVVVDNDKDEIIDNGYALLGGADVIREAENLGEETVFIRNLNNGIDYEVIMCQEDYGTIETDDPAPEDG